MAQVIFPPDFLDHSSEGYLPNVTVKTQLLYSACVVFILGVFVALPFVYVDVSVQTEGIIRTVAEKTEIKPLFAGHIVRWNIRENRFVKVGEPLLELATTQLDAKLKINLFQQEQQQAYLADLGILTQSGTTRIPQTPLYRQQRNDFQSQLSTLQTENTLLQREYETDQKLYADQVIARQEFERKENAYLRKEAEIRSLNEGQQATWEMAKKEHYLTLIDLQGQARELLEEKKLYTLYAPVSGTLQQITGKYPGSYVQAGEVLGQISPDSSLLAECYISPADIGLIHTGMPVAFQIDAFNYNDWGLIPGQVQEIGNDFVTVDKQPVFLVKCTLKRFSLRLPNGYTGNLKKGMTLHGRFTVTRRSLFQLLYDKVDDWVNPKVK
ncbi:MAG: HlyD family efflux transporter periplasmic adaptor subunit [Siphonobacter sp.]